MNHILYILPLSNSVAFKVGITNNEELNRIKGLHSIYKFNLNDGYIVRSDERIIKSLERQLLNDYSFYKHEVEDKSDGHTEFLKYDCLSNVLDDINFKTRLKHINMTIDKGVKIPKPKVNQILIKKKKAIPAMFNPLPFVRFQQLIEIHADELYYHQKNVSNGVESGVLGYLFSKNFDLLKTLYNASSFEYNNEGFSRTASFATGIVKPKNDEYSMLCIHGIYDDFENEKMFDIKVLYDYINMTYSAMNTILPQYNGTPLPEPSYS